MHQRSSPATNDPKCTDTRKTLSFLPRASRVFNALQNRCFRSYRFLSFNTNASRCAVYTLRLRRTKQSHTRCWSIQKHTDVAHFVCVVARSKFDTNNSNGHKWILSNTSH
uniref:(northern house mosquito) hypothetical protein n=1 Tax=Culex pipiens TaxID=7175 RepID=A0A8D8FFZ7_CULPI